MGFPENLNRDKFKTDDRVSINLAMFESGEGDDIKKGTVIGIAMDHIVQMMIIFLDKPITTPDGRLHRAIVVPASLLEPYEDGYTLE